MPYSAEILAIAERVNNWGRWGDGDQRGTVNFVTDDVVVAATASVRSGKRFSLAFPLQNAGLQTGAMPGRINPLRTMVALNNPVVGDPTLFCTSDDVVTMGLQAATHWDGLCHAGYDDRMYGGRSFANVSFNGAAECGIEAIGPLTSRGVLLDIAALHGVDELPAGHAIGREDIEAAEARQGVELRRGDIVAVRTGMMAKARAGDITGYSHGEMAEGMPFPGFPGIGLGAVEVFWEREVAAVATDTITFEVLPWDPAHVGALFPVHCLHLVEMGLTQGQNWDLEELAADCAADGQYDFLLEATPQPFVGGLGSPVNPVAVK
jgi:kynurenine formamidase